MSDNGKTTIAFLLGVITGGVLGIMYAPKSGRETREDLQRYVKNVEDKLSALKCEQCDGDQVSEQVDENGDPETGDLSHDSN